MYNGFLWPYLVGGAIAQTAHWPTQSFVTEPFHPVELVVNRTGSTADGYLFFAAEGENATMTPLIMDDRGDLVWQLDLSGTPLPPDDSDQLFMQVDVQPLDGQTYLTYFNGTSSGSHAYGAVHVLDHTYRQAYRICLRPDHVVPTATDTKLECYADMHESQFTDRGTVLLSLYNATRVDLTSVGGPKDGWVLDSQFYEVDIKTGAVKFVWKSLDHQKALPIDMTHYPLSNGSGTSVEDAFDYFHINSVALLPDGSYLVNSRHLWATAKLSSSGEVEWVLDVRPILACLEMQ